MDKTTDKLTGLLLKKEFDYRLVHEVQRAMRYRRPLTLMVMEVDWSFFEKELNIRASMPYTIFKQLGPIILKQLRTVDFAGRIAGETFCAMMPETPLAGAFVAADRLRQAVEGYEFIGDNLDRRLKVALNVGVASFPEHGTSADELMSSANKALLMARRDGGNKTVVFPQVLYQVSQVFRPFPGAPAEGGTSASGAEEPSPTAVPDGVPAKD